MKHCGERVAIVGSTFDRPPLTILPLPVGPVRSAWMLRREERRLPVISVVVPTRNRPAGLRECLQALQRQNYRAFEVIVVDDSSETPVAPLITAELRGSMDLLVLTNDRQRGPAQARNRAISAATGRYVAFVDDDVRVVPEWLELHLAAHEASDVPLGTVGPLAAPPDWRPQPWTRWESDTLQREYDRMLARAYEPTWRQFHTGNAFVERDAIRDAGGFGEQFLRAEDIELALRLSWAGLHFGLVAEAIGWHYSSRSLNAWLSAARAYGRFDRTLDRTYPQMGWLHVVERELAQRHPMIRATRALAARSRLRPAVVRSAAAVGTVAYRSGLSPAARASLSIAYDLEYVRGLNEEPEPGGASEQGWLSEACPGSPGNRA